MVRKKKKKRSRRSKKPDPGPGDEAKPIPWYLIPEPDPEPLEVLIIRHVVRVDPNRMKKLAEKPLPSTMTAAEIEKELRELLGE